MWKVWDRRNLELAMTDVKEANARLDDRYGFSKMEQV